MAVKNGSEHSDCTRASKAVVPTVANTLHIFYAAVSIEQKRRESFNVVIIVVATTVTEEPGPSFSRR